MDRQTDKRRCKLYPLDGVGKKTKDSRTRYRALGPKLIPVYRQSAHISRTIVFSCIYTHISHALRSPSSLGYWGLQRFSSAPRPHWRIQGGTGRGHGPPRRVGKHPECTKSRYFQTQNRKHFLGRGQCPLPRTQLVFLCINLITT